VRSAVLWRSGTQIIGQLIAWGSTFLVIRILSPADYGLFAMTQVVLFLLGMLSGYGLANALIQKPEVTHRDLRQLFGMLVLLNVGLALAQLLIAPLAAVYYRQPIIADLLRAQALLYLTTPFSAFAYALLARRMEFATQAKVNLLSAVAGALAAIGGASAGLGVWALVWAPIVLFATRAIGLTIATRTLVWPSFDFRGAGSMAKFGGLIAAGQLLGFIQFQADVLIGGRLFTAEAIGLYTTAIFLTQIFNNKFLPALNEIAFSAYARMQAEPAALAGALLRAVRVVLMVAMPFFFGLAATAEPVVRLVLGEKWVGAVPLVQLLAVAMPCMTVQALLQPASDALGRPGIAFGTSIFGALLMPAAFLIGTRWGVIGMAAAWLVAYPILLIVAVQRTLPALGLRAGELVTAAAPSVGAAAVMVGVVAALDGVVPLPDFARLPVLVAAGGAAYAGVLWVGARGAVREAVALVRNRG
jgi:O-antigen/teichoic acid export membrane protein